MAYSKVGIANVTLGRVGVEGIANLNEKTTASIQINLVWDYVLDKVLEAREWRFAKVRKALARSATTPESSIYDYAYPLPVDFLKICKDYPNDPALYPAGLPYIFEALDDGTECIFISYNDSSEELFLTYIRRITNAAKYTGSFVDAFANRLAAEVCIKLTESRAKKKELMDDYETSLREADGLNASFDRLENETGDSSWVDAGRQ